MTVVDLASIDGQRGMAQLVKPKDTMAYRASSGAASTRSISEASSLERLERCWPSRSGPSSMPAASPGSAFRDSIPVPAPCWSTVPIIRGGMYCLTLMWYD